MQFLVHSYAFDDKEGQYVGRFKTFEKAFNVARELLFNNGVKESHCIADLWNAEFSHPVTRKVYVSVKVHSPSAGANARMRDPEAPRPFRLRGPQGDGWRKANLVCELDLTATRQMIDALPRPVPREIQPYYLVFMDMHRKPISSVWLPSVREIGAKRMPDARKATYDPTIVAKELASEHMLKSGTVPAGSVGAFVVHMWQGSLKPDIKCMVDVTPTERLV